MTVHSVNVPALASFLAKMAQNHQNICLSHISGVKINCNPLERAKTDNETLAKQTLPHHIFDRADELVVKE